MSLSTTIGAGFLIGGVAAFAVYASAAPLDQETSALPAVPTFAPVPTPTVTMMAEDCAPPAVLTEGECVLTTPGPTILVSAPRWGPQTSASPVVLASGDNEFEDDGHDNDDDHDDDDDDHDDESEDD